MRTEHGTVYTRTDDHATTIYLERNGRTITMHTSETGPQDFWTFKFTNARFSPSGRYVFFDRLGWEWIDAYAYDTKAEQLIVTAVSPKVFEISSDERRLYTCALNEIGGVMYGKIFRMPDGTELADVIPAELLVMDGTTYTTGIDCSMSGSTIQFVVNEGRHGEPPTGVHEFIVDAETGRMLSRP